MEHGLRAAERYLLVDRLSPTGASFAGNFNTAATICLSLLQGFEALPAKRRGLGFGDGQRGANRGISSSMIYVCIFMPYLLDLWSSC